LRLTGEPFALPRGGAPQNDLAWFAEASETAVLRDRSHLREHLPGLRDPAGAGGRNRQRVQDRPERMLVQVPAELPDIAAEQRPVRLRVRLRDRLHDLLVSLGLPAFRDDQPLHGGDRADRGERVLRMLRDVAGDRRRVRADSLAGLDEAGADSNSRVLDITSEVLHEPADAAEDPAALLPASPAAAASGGRAELANAERWRCDLPALCHRPAGWDLDGHQYGNV